MVRFLFQVVCQVLGARMLEVETEEENAFITAEIQKRSGMFTVQKVEDVRILRIFSKAN